MTASHLMDTYARLPVAFVRGEGAWLFDEDGRRYLDALSGIGVCSLGHAHPEIAEAVCDQARTLIHTANLGRIPLQEDLAKRLCALAGMERAFITNTGAEANECAFKIARRVGHARGIETPKILVAEGAFHGRTLAAISASARGRLQEGFTPLVEGFVPVPFGDATAAERALAGDRDIVAVLVEPIQGEGGVRIPGPDYLTALRQACNQHRALLMVDEIQAGLGRTGFWFAHQFEPDSRPDVLTSAKALGNGVPVAACLARGEAATALTPGSHGTTFGGSPLACRAALTVLEIMQREDLKTRARELGRRIVGELHAALAGDDRVAEVRGRGLMIGVELKVPAAPVRDRALEAGLIVNATRETVIRMLPPLILDDEQAGRLVSILVDCVQRA